MPSTNTSPVTVVVPCFNDAARLPMLLRRLDLMREHEAANWHFTFVDDGSSDDTLTALLSASKTRSWISVVRHASRLGVAAALRKGLAASDSPVLCTMACSDPPAVLSELEQLVATKADIAVASPMRSAGSAAHASLDGGASEDLTHPADLDTLLSRMRAYRREVLTDSGLRGSGPVALAGILLRAVADGRVVRVVDVDPRGEAATSTIKASRIEIARIRLAQLATRMRNRLGRGAAANRAKRVLIVIENLPYPFDRRVFQEATTLRSAGYEVSVICPTGKGCEARSEDVDGVHVYRYPLPLEGEGILGYAAEYGAALAWQFALAWKVFFKHGFDAIHACNPPDNIFLIASVFKVFGKKFLFDHHDINPELYDAKFGKRGLPYKLICLFERLSFRAADVSIATNESYKEIAIERGGMDPDKVFVVRSGPDLRRMKIMRPCPELKKGRKHLVGYVGVMGRQEGIDYLLRAAHHLVYERGRDDIHFGLVGGGTELEAMKAYAVELGLENYTTFTGRAPDVEMLAMLNTADVCVNPDVANEMNDKSTMNKIMEYMALGKAIVQFDLCEGRVSAGDASLYARHNDELDFARKIAELLDDPARRSMMGRIGRTRVEKRLAWRYEAPKLLQAYAALFGEPATVELPQSEAAVSEAAVDAREDVALPLLVDRPQPVSDRPASASLSQ